MSRVVNAEGAPLPTVCEYALEQKLLAGIEAARHQSCHKAGPMAITHRVLRSILPSLPFSLIPFPSNTLTQINQHLTKTPATCRSEGRWCYLGPSLCTSPQTPSVFPRPHSHPHLTSSHCIKGLSAKALSKTSDLCISILPPMPLSPFLPMRTLAPSPDKFPLQL